MKYLYLFSDTNFFIHFEFFDQLNYSAIIGEPVTALVILPCVVRELEKLKTFNTDPHIYERAAQVIKALKSISREKGGVKDHTPLIMLDRDPTLDFAELGLSKEIEDDWFIASVLNFQRQNSDAKCVIVSNDAGVELKALTRGLVSIDPENTVARRQRITAASKRERELAKENENLQTEIELLRAKQPALSLSFEGGITQLGVKVLFPLPFSQAELQEASDYLQSTNRRIGAVMPNLFGSCGISSSEIAKYNSDQSAFIRKSLAFLENMHLADGGSRQSRVIDVSLYLSNSGTVPAEDNDIELYIPSGVIIHVELPKLALPPEPPENPLRRKNGESFDAVQMLQTFRSASAPINDSGPTKSDGGAIQYWFRSLKHGNTSKLKSFYIEIPLGSEDTRIQIPYTLASSNHPERQSGTLEINIETRIGKADWADSLRLRKIKPAANF